MASGGVDGYRGWKMMLLDIAENRGQDSSMRSNAALIEEYFNALGNYSTGYKSVLEQLCRRLSQPDILNAQVSIFSPRAEAIADSRLENPLIVRPLERPEVVSALNKEIGSSVRYSQLDRRRMAFVARPHLHLGKVDCVIRVGVPYASVDGALWGAYLKIAAAGLGLAIVAASLSSLLVLYRGGTAYPWN